MRQFGLAVALLGLAGIIGLAREEAPAKKQAAGGANSAGEKQAYLGVQLEPLPPALASQLSGIVPKGQGILVLHVAKDSPAAKAGLQPHDIVTSYNEHKLSSPEQLVKLVRADKPGHEVTLGFVRGSKTETAKVALGEREALNTAERPRVFRLRPDERFQEMFEEVDSKNGSPAWEEFESMKLTRLENKRLARKSTTATRRARQNTRNSKARAPTSARTSRPTRICRPTSAATCCEP